MSAVLPVAPRVLDALLPDTAGAGLARDTSTPVACAFVRLEAALDTRTATLACPCRTQAARPPMPPSCAAARPSSYWPRRPPASARPSPRARVTHGAGSERHGRPSAASAGRDPGRSRAQARSSDRRERGDGRRCCSLPPGSPACAPRRPAWGTTDALIVSARRYTNPRFEGLTPGGPSNARAHRDRVSPSMRNPTTRSRPSAPRPSRH